MAIIKTIEDLTKYVETSSLTRLDLVSPSIRTAERDYLVPVLGRELYADIISKVNSEADLDELDSSLLELAREAVANIGMAISISRLAVQFSENGVTRNESQNSKSAYQYQEMNLRDSLTIAGFNVLEDLLSFLEENSEHYQLWKESSAYTTFKAYFIQSGVELNQYYDCKRSRLTYMRVRPIMRAIENFTIKDITGKELFAALKAGQLAGTLVDAYKALLSDYICPAVALMTMAKAAVQRLVDITEEGISVSRLADYNNVQARDHAPGADTDTAYNALMAEANEYLKRLGEELAENPGDYPAYVPPVARPAMMAFKNDKNNGVYGV
jgi:hypothetical protein